MAGDRKVAVENVSHPEYRGQVKADKYEAMKAGLQSVLPARSSGLSQSDMTGSVRPHLPDDLFPGGRTTGWWAKGAVTRHQGKPLRWMKNTV